MPAKTELAKQAQFSNPSLGAWVVGVDAWKAD